MLHLDAHEKPPQQLRDVYKKYSKHKDQRDYSEVLDLGGGLKPEQEDAFSVENFAISSDSLGRVFSDFVSTSTGADELEKKSLDNEPLSKKAYTSTTVKGLTIIPSLLPPEVQMQLLSRMFHRDLSRFQHKTNIDLHYDLDRPSRGQSFFDLDPAHSVGPKDSEVHKAITIQQLLGKKLRWMTLGGQYDWTNKVYPNEQPPPFPDDIRDLLSGIFPKTTAEAAIVNLYSPGDTLSLHRDVSEECDRGLISVSIGCDCLFMLGLERGDMEHEVIHEDVPAKEPTVDYLVLRLRSGDAIYMAGESRFAWHGVPLIIPGTCPPELSSWPASSAANNGEDAGKYETWRKWMATKRINLNVRQMKA